MNHSISSEDAFTLLEQGGAIFIDVRTSREYGEGHIPQALNLDIYGSGFAGEVSRFDKNKVYIMNCQTGGRSGLATDFMVSAGFEKVYNLTSGFSAWKRKGLPAVKGN